MSGHGERHSASRRGHGCDDQRRREREDLPGRQAAGCGAPSAPFAFTGRQPVATITAGGPRNLCGADASVTLTASAGSAYLWQPSAATTQSITVSSAGTYQVTVTDAAGCSVTS